MMTTEERQNLEQTMSALEAQRAVLGDLVVDTALQPLREKLAALLSEPLADERKPVTILLADVKGSTDLAERLSMETWVDVMNRLLQIMQAEVYRFGGTVNQFRGDGLLAFFGASVLREDDPERAVLAALAMQEASRPYAAELALREGIEVLLRVGINTGEVIVTHVGDRRFHSEDTAMGRAVALAARMETSAEPGSVLVSENTYRLVHHLFEWDSLGEIQVKGIHQPVGVYRPRMHRPAPGKGRGVAGLASPLVGRNTEFRSLQTAIVRLQAGAGGVVTLVGDAGLGKSRLVAELRQWATAQSPDPDSGPQFLQWVEGRCVSYDTSSAYLLWIDVLRAMLGMEPDDSLDAVRAALHDRVAVLCGDAFDEVYPYLYRLLSLDPAVDSDDKPVTPRTGPEGERLRQGTFGAIARLLSQAARSYPLVIVCEDLHWADPTSLDLLEYLLPLMEQVPLLFVCVSRPGKAESEEGGENGGRLQGAAAQYPQRRLNLNLVPLDALESETLVRNLLRVENLPPALKARILGYADGNPFYLEEILRSLMADGAIAYRPVVGCWEVTRAVSDIAIPETLYGVLIARIDRLPPDTKRLLQLAAIIGRIFAGAELAVVATRCGVLSAGDEATLERHLAILQQAELIRERSRKAEHRMYIFKHHLTQQAVYNSVLQKERRLLHAHVAEALKQVHANQLWEQSALLAHHWEQTDEPQHAIPHLIRAAAHSELRFANEEALAYLRRALHLAREANLALAEADALFRVSHVLGRQGDYAGSRSHLEKALIIYQGFGNQRRVGLLLTELGALSLRQGDYSAAAAYFEQTLTISRLVGNRHGEIGALNNLGTLCLGRGAYTDARAHFEQARRLNLHVHNDWEEAAALAGLGALARILGDYGSAAALTAGALAFYRRFRNRSGIAHALNATALLARAQGRLAEAQESCAQALGLFDEIDERSGSGDSLTILGCILSDLGVWEEAESAYTRALNLRRDLGERLLAAEPLAGLARAALSQGDLRQALAYVEDILSLAAVCPALDGVDDGFAVYRTCHAVLSASGEVARAGSALQTAQTLLQERAAGIEPEPLRRSFLETHRLP